MTQYAIKRKREEFCATLDYNPVTKWADLPHHIQKNLAINHNKRFIFNTGGAGAAWRKFLSDLNPGGEEILSEYLKKTLNDTTRIDDYQTFFVVQNPLKYILTRYQMDFGTPEAARTNINKHNDVLPYLLNSNITIIEFLNWVLSAESSFPSQYDLTLPCDSKYTYTIMHEGMAMYKQDFSRMFGLNNTALYYSELDLVETNNEKEKWGNIKLLKSLLSGHYETREDEVKAGKRYLKRVGKRFRTDYELYSGCSSWDYYDIADYSYGYAEKQEDEESENGGVGESKDNADQRDHV